MSKWQITTCRIITPWSKLFDSRKELDGWLEIVGLSDGWYKKNRSVLERAVLEKVKGTSVPEIFNLVLTHKIEKVKS